MKRGPAPWALTALLLVLGAARAAAAPVPPPAVEAAREGVVLTRLPPILADEEVKKQLATGLTTSFLFEVRAQGGDRARGGARVDVRYDLWDEVYIVTRVDAAAHVARVRLPSFEKLAEWWRDVRLVALRPQAGATARGIEVRLSLIPFSQAEQLDAQRWFSQSLSAERTGSAGAVSEAVEDQPESFSQVLNLLMATSIGRAPLLELQWNLALPGRKK